MRINEITLKGFRNYKDTKINLSQKSLIIGSNDIGKSNLLYALRIILDKSLSEIDLEPKDSDFYVHEATNEILILLKLEDIKEECVIAKLREYVNDDGSSFLGYRATRDPNTKSKSYQILAGHDIQNLKELDHRFYIKALNLKYIGSNRDLFSFIKRERKNLLQDAKIKRTDEKIEKDSVTLLKIDKSLDIINRKVTRLSYIQEATTNVNKELKELSFHNEGQQVIFNVSASDASQFVDSLELVSQVNDKKIAVGGDGRNNQIFLALWVARNSIQDEEPLEVCIYCIEEPECHLHPHQQRKLANYLANILKSQVIITTHSSQIACEFSPKSIIRLYDNEPDTKAACNGSSDLIEEAFIKFGHRLNIIPAEAFFSKVVLLVEGASEVLFYKALAHEIGIDLDRLNISILMVDGVGFETYADLLCTLNIDFVIRTDNDIFKIPEKNKYRFAGLERAIKTYKRYCQEDKNIEKLLEDKKLLSEFGRREPPKKNYNLALKVKNALEDYDIFLADIDLENDLKNSELKEKISEFFPKYNDNQLVAQMQKQKASFMYSFLRKYANALSCLKEHAIAKPLIRCREIAEGKKNGAD